MADARIVLVPIDFSPRARAAALRACDLAVACDAGIRLIHGASPRQTDLEPETVGAGESVRSLLPRQEIELWRADLEARGARVSALVEEEDPVDLISRHGHAEDVVLVVMGMHGFRGYDRLYLGSVADRALRLSQIPIMIVKETEGDVRLGIRRILLATDFSPASEHALRLAIQWARCLGADVEVLHAIQEPEGERDYPRPRDSTSRSGHRRTNALESLRSILSRTAAAGVRAVADLTYGTASVEIVKHAARSHADLVVLGLRDASVDRPEHCGSVTERVIRHVKCSVMVAPDETRSELGSESDRGQPRA